MMRCNLAVVADNETDADVVRPDNEDVERCSLPPLPACRANRSGGASLWKRPTTILWSWPMKQAINGKRMSYSATYCSSVVM
jgi:hypothetical protein